MHIKNTSLTLIFTLLSLLGVAGCSSDFAAAMRKVTYPPDFKYVTGEELRSDMHSLAYQLVLLDGALDNPVMPSNGSSDQQQQVLDNLDKIKHIASSLHAGDAGASHPFLQDGMGAFINKVEQARTAASLAEPRYDFASKVSDACAKCHKINRY